MKSVSVIIPTHGKARFLDVTLASFVRQSHRDYELVVIDDGSRDDTPEVIARWAAELPIKHRRQENAGRSAARNAALAFAEGDLLVFSDDDRVVAPDFVEAHAVAAREGDRWCMGWQRGLMSFWRPDLPLDPRILARLLARTTLPEPGAAPIALVSPEDVRDRFDLTVGRYGIEERWWIEGCLPVIERHGDELEGFGVPWVLGTTGNLSVPRKTIVEIGGFDPSFAGWGLEDLELCYRLHHAGLRARVARQAVSWHQAHPTGAGKRGQWLANLLRFMQRHQRLDAALYGHYFTRPHVVDLHEFDALCGRMHRDEVPPRLRQELMRAYRQLVEIRVRTLGWSGGGSLPALVQDEW